MATAVKQVPQQEPESVYQIHDSFIRQYFDLEKLSGVARELPVHLEKRPRGSAAEKVKAIVFRALNEKAWNDAEWGRKGREDVFHRFFNGGASIWDPQVGKLRLLHLSFYIGFEEDASAEYSAALARLKHGDFSRIAAEGEMVVGWVEPEGEFQDTASPTSLYQLHNKLAGAESDLDKFCEDAQRAIGRYRGLRRSALLAALGLVRKANRMIAAAREKLV